MATIEAAICKHMGFYKVTDQSTRVDLEWYGHSFNPPDYNNALSNYYGPKRIDPVDVLTTVDMSSLYPGTEVAMGSMTVIGPYTPPSTGTKAYIRWVQGNLPYIIYEVQWSPPSLSSTAAWVNDFYSIGYRPTNLEGVPEEIYQNAGLGDEYECIFRLYESGGTSQIVTKTLEVTGIDTTKHTLRTPGMFWVEGDNIHFISGYGFEHTVKNDGNTYATGLTNTGSVWVPNTTGATYLEYVDSSGNKRRTFDGDILDSWISTESGVGSTGHTAGYIWVQEASRTFLMFVNYDGTVVRLSNGDINSNRY